MKDDSGDFVREANHWVETMIKRHFDGPYNIPCAVSHDLARYMKDEDMHARYVDALDAKMDEIEKTWDLLVTKPDPKQADWLWTITDEDGEIRADGWECDPDQARAAMRKEVKALAREVLDDEVIRSQDNA